eukprot:CAMPEP_0116008034 /NCGR_PEP_ID=MMETSP0321-20121206/2635_1 /TAXON_ID=163516 /ORGANISM="Leptocylindrus danicus var. danicus, Strain B650" /LENGTH=68 /DNA_ID=CAMNT_0003476805 /DNA_START=701 /DNA_END=907 /DNA_ORIENTATION=-
MNKNSAGNTKEGNKSKVLCHFIANAKGLGRINPRSSDPPKRYSVSKAGLLAIIFAKLLLADDVIEVDE